MLDGYAMLPGRVGITESSRSSSSSSESVRDSMDSPVCMLERYEKELWLVRGRWDVLGVDGVESEVDSRDKVSPPSLG